MANTYTDALTDTHVGLIQPFRLRDGSEVKRTDDRRNKRYEGRTTLPFRAVIDYPSFNIKAQTAEAYAYAGLKAVAETFAARGAYPRVLEPGEAYAAGSTHTWAERRTSLVHMSYELEVSVAYERPSKIPGDVDQLVQDAVSLGEPVPTSSEVTLVFQQGVREKIAHDRAETLAEEAHNLAVAIAKTVVEEAAKRMNFRGRLEALYAERAGMMDVVAAELTTKDATDGGWTEEAYTLAMSKISEYFDPHRTRSFLTGPRKRAFTAADALPFLNQL